MVKPVLLAIRDQSHGVGRYTLAGAGKSHTLGSCGLYRHVAHGQTHRLGEGTLHFGDVGTYFGFLQHHGAVDIRYIPLIFCKLGNYLLKQHDAVNPFVRWIGIGKMEADIAKVGSSQQSVAHRMDQDIGIAMTFSTFVKRDIDTANSKTFSFNEFMHIVTKTNFYLHGFQFSFQQTYEQKTIFATPGAVFSAYWKPFMQQSLRVLEKNRESWPRMQQPFGELMQQRGRCKLPASKRALTQAKHPADQTEALRSLKDSDLFFRDHAQPFNLLFNFAL